MLTHFLQAHKKIKPYICQTPLIPSMPLTEFTAQSIYLKCEMMQPTGAFKLRGAANKLLSLTAEQKQKGVVAVSTGNHGCAVAYMAQTLGIKAHIYVSNNVPQNKLDNIRRYGGKVVIVGNSQDEAEVSAQEAISSKGLTMIHPFDDDQVIKGQGTIALELFSQLDNINSIVVPLSGGGLIGGIAACAKMIKPDIKIIGVSMKEGAAMYQSLKQGMPVAVTEIQSLADSLQGGIGLENRYTFALAKQFVDEVVLVDELQILKAMRYMLLNHRFLLEGAAVVGIAAIQNNLLRLPAGNCAVILSGNNVQVDILDKIMADRLQQTDKALEKGQVVLS
ncbi:pyridoxal-phosphate dependent enzyme [Facilibium subflavum]|uniref:pyridoxal-phosphate dependent enzyme n=1 Tax=Facilibium subflavum TaxID=2219058 RepID=UPI0013C359A4|nr:pyridoxal-phosphate dependent enzyme [Facilibium subflavum]